MQMNVGEELERLRNWSLSEQLELLASLFTICVTLEILGMERGLMRKVLIHF